MSFIYTSAFLYGAVAAVLVFCVLLIYAVIWQARKNATPEPTQGMGDEPYSGEPEHQGPWGSKEMRGPVSTKGD